jgi:hypothetical protein
MMPYENGELIMRFHAVLLDETRCEFGADVDAEDREAAYKWLEDQYPESNVIQLESPNDTRQREAAMNEHIERGGDWDDDGRPIFHYSGGDYMDFEGEEE